MQFVGYIIAIVFISMSFQIQASERALIDVVDSTPFHIHSDQNNITITLTRSKTLPVYYQWRDYRGKPVTERKLLTALINTTKIPSTKPAYYGLVFMVDEDVVLNDRWPGEELEFGFGVIDSDKEFLRDGDYTEHFGTVHTDVNDPYMPTWIKTMTWNTASPESWKNENCDRNNLGLKELPIIVDDGWETDDDLPVSEIQLSELKLRASEYFKADKKVAFWELGIEENLQGNFEKKYYWQNLAAKSEVIRQAADQINPDLKLIYQIAELDLKPVRLFLNSKAVNNFDILSLHPYKWPDFSSAEKWLPQYLKEVRNEMKKADRKLPIWFTEVGAPHHGNHPDHFFGYPDFNEKVQGLSRSRSAAYMSKLHVVAFQQGVEKIFWYNYMDRESDREYAENHFGLVDFIGYPKPAYLAYVHLYSQLRGKTAAGVRTIDEDVLVYTFENEAEKTMVIWGRSTEITKVAASDLSVDLKQSVVTNAVGTPIQFEGEIISVSDSPIFITSQK